MDGTGEHCVKLSEPSSQTQRWHINTYMIIYTYILYIYIYIHTHTRIYSERENKIVLLGLSEGTMGGGRRKNVRE
jgi:hypothetical protein